MRDDIPRYSGTYVAVSIGCKLQKGKEKLHLHLHFHLPPCKGRRGGVNTNFTLTGHGGNYKT